MMKGFGGELVRVSRLCEEGGGSCLGGNGLGDLSQKWRAGEMSDSQEREQWTLLRSLSRSVTTFSRNSQKIQALSIFTILCSQRLLLFSILNSLCLNSIFLV